MEEKNKEINEEIKEQNKQSNNNEIQNYQSKIKELNNKINVLIKGVKEEREKSKKLSKEIEVLNLDKILKEETISKLRSENESLNSILSKDDPKSYFENITKLNTDINFNPEEYDKMKKENVQLIEEKNNLIEQNSELINKIEKLTEEKKNIEKNLNEEIYKLKKERIELTNDIFDKQKKIELLNNLYKEIENQKNNKENEIIKYKEEEKNYKKNVENLENQIKFLKNENKKNINEINKLKKDIEDKIKIEIDDYVFNGIIIEDSFNDKKLYNKNISVKFSSTQTFIILKFDEKKLKIDAKDIKFTFPDKEKNNVIIFFQIEEQKNSKKTIKGKDSENNDENINNENNIINDRGSYSNKKNDENENLNPALLCQFTEKECNYMYKFKKEMMDKYNEIKKNKEKEENTFNSFLFGFFQ